MKLKIVSATCVALVTFFIFLRIELPETQDVTPSTLRFHLVYQDRGGNEVSDPTDARALARNNVFYKDQMGRGLFIETPEFIDETCLKNTAAGLNPYDGAPVINFILTTPCADTFAQYTRDNRGRRIAIIVNDQLLGAPRISAPITSGASYFDVGAYYPDLRAAETLAKSLKQ